MPKPSTEAKAALFAILNNLRALRGWSLASIAELEPIICIWHEELRRHDIPVKHYQTLFNRACDARSLAIQAGKTPPDIDAFALVAAWLGPQGLRAELRRKQIDDRRSLPANAESICQLCNGFGWYYPKGFEHGVLRCDHQNS